MGCPGREEVKGGARRRMDMAFRWVRLERPLGWVWTRRVRVPGARALGSSSSTARRLGGLAGCQLIVPVSGRGPGSELAPQRAVAPRSRAGGAMPRRGLKRTPGFSKAKFCKTNCYARTVPCPGAWLAISRCCFSLY